MERITSDVEAFHLGVADLDAFLVDRRVEDGLDFEPGRGCGGCDQIDDRSMIGERPAAPILRNMAEQAVLDLVPFRGARRIVPHLDGEAGFVCKLLEFLPSRAAHVNRSSRRNPP